MKTRTAALLAVLGFSGCAGGELKKAQADLQSARERVGDLRTKVNEQDARLAALEGEKADAAGRAADLEAKLQASLTRIDSLVKSNKDLSSSIEAKEGALAAKVKELVAEKDELSRRLDELQKAKAGAERTKAETQRKLDAARVSREKLLADLAALRQQHEDLLAKARDAEDLKKAADLAAQERRAKTREDLGGVADAALKEIQAGTASIDQDGESFALTLREALLFKPQQAKLTEGGIALLDRVGRALHALASRPVRIEGHSDNSPIKWELFGFTSHWELSAARATAVARHLHEHGGLDPRRLTASGFGEFRPVQGNDTPAGREVNRRVVLVVEPGR